MFESDDWIFQDAFNEDEVEEKTRRRSQAPCRNIAEKAPSAKRRRVDSCQASPSTTDSTLVGQSGCDTVANVEDNDHVRTPFQSVSRTDLLRIFQNTSRRETFEKNFAKEIENDPSGVARVRGKTRPPQPSVEAAAKCPRVSQHQGSREKTRESASDRRLAKEVKLIRIFPGPAGLIPDVKSDGGISAASYLSDVKELEKSATKPRGVQSVQIKSQDEKNLVGERAWKLLSNDLPTSFLQDYNVSAVTDRADATHCDSAKVRFFAGILDYIDHSHDDPFVILKDSTGSIEGTIHRDIPLAYPGLLEPNVVIFLRDVGLLKTTTYVVTNKYHILVSLANLIAVYSDKGRIVSTSLMESILSRAPNAELNRIIQPDDRMPVCTARKSGPRETDESCEAAQFVLDSSGRRPRIEACELTTNTPLSRLTSETYETSKGDKVTNQTLGRFNDSIDLSSTDDLDSINFADFADCDPADFAIPEEQDRSQCVYKSTSEIQRCRLQEEGSTERLENVESTQNFQRHTKERRSTQVPRTLNRCTTDANTKNSGIRYSRDNNFSSYDDAACRDSSVNERSTLQVKRNIENSKALVSYFTNDNDSDDEILSQLDVDNVFEPKKDC
ncbi:PREDICTED: uncharacterized protein LOC105560688 [Vollenhovia emeryi]|uniref:uncharacterized protein LOC105560688 n=1 Tax=Vollenhovia emeryi TaxID=411798 RepID=UPI0005F424DD|nr:PREDICTED: uncharacterized protein LOC105560688 [Vollenhovia emeryi]